ncbi:MAG TPA: alpha/beta hydrolase [Planctomycetota bacterium]|nr:alpha/beta hydrolase [Planctomycetota bacterium]
MLDRFRNWLVPAILLSPAAMLGAEGLTLPLWPDLKVEAGAGDESVTERGRNGKQDRSFKNVRVPTITVYQPEKPNGAAVIVCPGGGYGSLALDKEGHDVARWLCGAGITGIVLKYRLPRPELSKGEAPWPLQDAQQALRLVRSRAAEWKIDPRRVGMMGFSAGGHLVSAAATHFDEGRKDAAGDKVASQSCRPDFAVLVYAVVSMGESVGHSGARAALLGKSPDSAMIERYSSHLQVTAQTPPCFLVHAKDDKVKAENSVLFSEALKKAGVPCELQLYEKGGHGYGLGINGGEVATWPERCLAWLHAQKFLDAR